MKKLVSLTLVLFVLCSVFAVTASMAEEEGVNFNDIQFMYDVEGNLESEPVTVEATVFLNKRRLSAEDCGTFFGNYHWDETSHNMDFGISTKGVPVIRVRDDAAVYRYAFDEVSVCKSEWIHLTLVRDVAKKEARCYVNGELAQTLPMTESYSPLDLFDFKIGSNLAYLNHDYFKGALKSIAVYSDVRTDAEIKSDVEKLRGKRVLVIDDVISTGASLNAIEALADKAGANIVGKMAVLAEGDAMDRGDIIALDKLPVFNPDGTVKG